MSDKTYRLFVDVDWGDTWLWRTPNPLWDNLLPLVRMEARRLAGLYPLGDLAVIERSDDGWHIKFTQAKLSKDEEETLMIMSRGHRGHVHFSLLMHDSTLRWDAKPTSGSHKTLFREVIHFG